MATQSVTVARIYVREGERLLSKIMKLLHDQEKVLGVTVFRGIAGFGPDGKLHTSSLVDLSLDLPLVVEFYDDPQRMETVLDRLAQCIQLPHVVTWPATCRLPDALHDPAAR